MGHCPGCGTELLSPQEAAGSLDVSDGRVRAILSRHPQRLDGGRVGWGWLVSRPGVEGFTPQPSGVHLEGADSELGPVIGQCPVCGEKLLAPREVAATLGVSVGRVHAILASEPERLLAFRVGRLWFIPGRGLTAYQKSQVTRKKVLDALAGRGDEETTVLVIAPGRLPTGAATGEEIRIKVTFGPEVCYCDNVKTKKTRMPGKRFPHRAGGGDCPNKPRVLRGMLIAEIQTGGAEPSAAT